MLLATNLDRRVRLDDLRGTNVDSSDETSYIIIECNQTDCYTINIDVVWFTASPTGTQQINYTAVTLEPEQGLHGAHAPRVQIVFISPDISKSFEISFEISLLLKTSPTISIQKASWLLSCKCLG